MFATPMGPVEVLGQSSHTSLEDSSGRFSDTKILGRPFFTIIVISWGPAS